MPLNLPGPPPDSTRPPATARAYGEATTDPNGRDGWRIDKRTRLPIRPPKDPAP